MKYNKEEWSAKLQRSLEIKRQASAEAKSLLERLQHELDTQGYYSLHN